MVRGSRFVVACFATLLSTATARADGAAAATPTPALPVDSLVLANGLHVILAPDPKASLVCVVVSYGAGSADDPDGRRGLAHFTEHLVAEHTKHIANALGTLFAAGAAANAHTGLDRTTYEETLPPERIETALWVESDRMGYAADVVDDDVVRGTRATVANETRDTVADRSLAVLPDIAGDALFPSWHPYHGLSQDVGADVDSIFASDIRAFLATWYSPANATLVVAGRFDEAALSGLVKRYFERLPAAPPPVRPTLPPFTRSAASFEVGAPIPADAVLFEWETPAFGEHDDAALDLAAAVLRRRLGVKLVARGLASSVAAHQVSKERGSVFLLSVTPGPRVAPAAVATEMEAMVKDVAGRVTPEETDGARRDIQGARLVELETPERRALLLASLASFEPPDAKRSDWGMARYESVTVADVSRVVARWLGPERRLTITERANFAQPARGRIVREWP